MGRSDPPKSEWLTEEEARQISEEIERNGWNQPDCLNGHKHRSLGHMNWGAPAAFYHINSPDGKGGGGGPVHSLDGWERTKQYLTEQTRKNAEKKAGQPSLF